MSGRGGGWNDHHRRDSYRGGGRGGGGYYDRGPPPPRSYGGDRRGGSGSDHRGGYDDHYRSGHYGDQQPQQQYARGGRGYMPQQQQQRRHRRPPPNNNNSVVTFNSYEEERAWVEERRRKRQNRTSKFDVKPSAATAAAAVNPAAIAASAVAAVYVDGGNLPQQTRHARRLYVGNLPPFITEQQIHTAFREAIRTALVSSSTNGTITDPNDEDPILTVYINHERRFCFLEFKTVEMTTACMALDGLKVAPGQPPVKVKRPNDYNPAMAPLTSNNNVPVLDVSRLGIISSTVEDGPNKIFIGGLHYHLQEAQVLELLSAFGKVKAFHLVKNEPDTTNSKGYCFVEYADSSVTPIAVAGLNGMDIGGGKSITARLAGERTTGAATVAAVPPPQSLPTAATAAVPSQQADGVPPNDKTIVFGYDVEAMVDAAMGQGTMPVAPQYFDAYGQPLTRIVPIIPIAAAPAAVTVTNQDLLATLQHANMTTTAAATQQQQIKTRILVLLNMVSDEDLATDEDHQALVDEVREECAKFGALRDIQIPRKPTTDGTIEPSAIRKVFLEYATPQDAAKAEEELKGRQFGSSVVEIEYFSESDFAAGRLR